MIHNEITLSLDNLLHNVSVIKDLSQSSKILAVVKANAYGHGTIGVVDKLDKLDSISAFGVSSIEEAIEIKNTTNKQIVIMSDDFSSEASIALAYNEGFEVVFHNEANIEALEKVKSDYAVKGRLRIWFKVDTGMGRLGFSLDEAAFWYGKLLDCTNSADDIVIMSHFGCADIKDHPLNQEQITLFSDFLKKVQAVNNKKFGENIIVNDWNVKNDISLYNSSAILNKWDVSNKLLKNKNNYVRVGIGLYGISPFEDIMSNELNLKPIMTLKSRIISIHKVKKGSAIGYNCRYECQHDKKIGIVSIGYYDGYPSNMQDGAPTIVNDVVCPILGRVSMNMITIDLDRCDSAKVGDTVILFGEDIPIETLSLYTDNAETRYSILASLQKGNFRYVWS